MHSSMIPTNIDTRNKFWQLADLTHTSEKYKIDQNLRYLKIAPLPILRKIFTQYRFFTQYYITDLALLISKLPFGHLKTILSEILYEELGNGNADAAHPELYDSFLESIGIPQEKLLIADPACIKNLTTIQDALVNRSWAYGVGLRGMGGECLCQIYLSTMYDYFSQNPVIAAISDTIDWRFWEIHIGEADIHHQTIVRAAIDQLIIHQPETLNDLTEGYLESKEAWDNYWTHIFSIAKINIKG